MEQMKLLIVDDDFNVRSIFERYFTSKGCFVETAANGIEALSKFKKNNFDYLITDIEMPEMNGIELIETIRFKLKNRKLPIIIYSNNVDNFDNVNRRGLDILKIIQKPVINFDKFFKILHV